MDKWLVNMVAGATLAALLVIFGGRTFVEEVYPTGGEPQAPAPHSETAGAEGGAGQAEEQAPQLSLASLLGAASAEAGEKQARKCAACHSFDEGGPNKIGPNLHGIVGRPVASHEGFAYSSSLQDYGGEWTYEKLDCFIHDPKSCVPGNKMSFAGVKKDSDRADVIAYLRSISPNAPPLPEEEKAASAEGADAEATTAEAAQNGSAEAGSAPSEEAAAASAAPAQN